MADDGLRADGRTPEQLRPIRIASDALSQPSGSASVSFGSTSVCVAVYGPKPLEKRLGFSKNGVISCDVKTLKGNNKVAHSGIGTETVIKLETIPNSSLEIQGVVLESDGSELGVIITAASLAVAYTGIAMCDLVTACHVVGFEGRFYLDPTELESKKAEFEMIIAGHPSTNEVCYFTMNGTVLDSAVPQALERTLAGCSAIRTEIAKTLI